MQGLQGRKIIVAGGATGIGAATAMRLASEGAQVFVGDIYGDRAEQTADIIRSEGGHAASAKFDLASEESIVAFHRLAVDEMGGVDGLFNVGADLRGTASNLPVDDPNRDGDILDMNLDVWRRTFEINLLGYVHMARAVLPGMIAQGSGAIVNTSSGAASGTLPTRCAYGVSKAGVEAITRHIASRWGKQGIRCNCVAPGLVMGEKQLRSNNTAVQAQALQRVQSPRLGTPDDLAAAVAFLLSDDAEWINGQVWKIDGGMGN